MPPLHLRLARDVETKLQEEKAKNKELNDELQKIKCTLSQQQSFKAAATVSNGSSAVDKRNSKIVDGEITIKSLTSPMEGFVKLTE